MNKSFTYSLLKYRYNQLTEESLNLGILFIFPGEGHISFVAPSSLGRLEHAFPGVSIQDVRAYLKSFEGQAKKLKPHLGRYADDYQSLINEQFLIPNGSSIHFDELHNAPLWKDVPTTIDLFSNQYLAGYGKRSTEGKVQQHTEAYILDKYKKLLTEKAEGRELSTLVKEKTVIVENEITSFSSDLYWRNGTQNLVKAVSFDLTTEEGIENKAFALSKRLDLLGELFEKNNQRVDILVSKPSKPGLKHVYQNAKEVLKAAGSPHQVIEEGTFQRYVAHVLKKAVVLP